MEYLRWTADLDTGIEPIDKQHRGIVDLINELNKANETQDLDVTKKVLNKLVEYTVSHFSFEEDMQIKANYPYIKAHKRLHEVFIKRIENFIQRDLAGENITDELLSVLKTWLINHIYSEDKDYVEIVKKTLVFDVVEVRNDGWLNIALKTDLLPIFKTALTADLVPLVKTAFTTDMTPMIKTALTTDLVPIVKTAWKTDAGSAIKKS